MNLRLFKWLFVLPVLSFWTVSALSMVSCPNLKPDAGQAQIGKIRGHDIKTAVIHENLVPTIYNRLKNMNEIPYRYVIDGCDVRAYLGAKEIHDAWGLPSFRVNLNSNQGMYAETPFTLEGGVAFTKHSALALCVYREGSGTVEPIVFDISFFESAVNVSDWIAGVKDEYVSREPEFYVSSMWNLNPDSNRRNESFDRFEMSCAEETRARFMVEQRRIDNGHRPIGVGRGRENLREQLCY